MTITTREPAPAPLADPPTPTVSIFAIHWMDRSGDTQTLYVPGTSNRDDVDLWAELDAEIKTEDEARAIFDSAMALSHPLAYTVDTADPTKGQVIKDFEPAEKIIVHAQFVGG